MANYIIIAVVILWAVWAARSYIKQRRSGNFGCGGSCSGCSGNCAACSRAPRKDDQNEAI